MKQVNAKLLNDHIKKGWTATDFATYLGISDELFWDILKKEFTRNAYEGFRSSLRKNEKHQKNFSCVSSLCAYAGADRNCICRSISHSL